MVDINPRKEKKWEIKYMQYRLANKKTTHVNCVTFWI